MRGIYPDELDEDGAYAIGRAYAELFSPQRLAVGRDMRISAPSMSQAVMAGLAEGGAEVLDLGMVGTEMVYFAVGSLGLDGGIVVTASHNPKQYTGMKIVRAGALPVGGESGLMDIRDRALHADGQGQTPVGRVESRPLRHLAVVRRPRPLLRRRRADQAAPGRDRRRERHGRRDAAARPRAAADRRRPLLLRARRDLPESRAEPAAAGEPRVHRPQDARGEGRPRRRLRRGRRPLLLLRRHGRVRPRRLRDRASGRVDPGEGAGAPRSSTTSAPAGPSPRRSSEPAGSRSSAASGTRSSST